MKPHSWKKDGEILFGIATIYWWECRGCGVKIVANPSNHDPEVIEPGSDTGYRMSQNCDLTIIEMIHDE